ncbi:phospholipase A1 [Neisseria elongata subsp. glycolytica ATCC 29315]|uniref:Phospholipase A1 n=1 Tax=Neisseria elongata subsp. glycolytica ATCC 29315 TaxID=546263 RepID=D4DTK5_NEIEG|nr:phospholipase A [Neisseria elongata]AJE19178.1 phospholipase A1 [Neisseria elongata subsp. glycolytica ATCC 29315]EFE48820.1 phospholipase A1 [Neisseria elongata subsp. glycolytica ATCC 29315]SQH48941.1 phopholipase [Neisseria elongata subsp. glycolytica]
MYKYRFLLFAVAAALPAAAVANDAALQCTLLQDNALRLACYDKVFAAQLPPEQPLSEHEADGKPQLDVVQSVRQSIGNKEATLVFDTPEGQAEPSQELADAAAAYTPLSQMYDLDANDPHGILTVREHNPMYLMPIWYNSSPNYAPSSPTRGAASQERFSDQKRIETKMQVSFKSKIAEDLFKSRADLWFGYTQKSDWQIYNQGRRSAPFRNTDYEPEIFITQPVKAQLPWGGRLRMLGVGFAHQSNGQSRPESRSWNKVYAMAGMEWGKLTVIPRVWMRLFDSSGKDNDNPDLTKYLGYGDVKLQYRLNDKHNFSTTLRYNPKSGYGAAEAAYTFPIKGKLQGVVRGFHGYGESLIDYNHKQSGIGFGLMFNGWDGF